MMINSKHFENSIECVSDIEASPRPFIHQRKRSDTPSSISLDEYAEPQIDDCVTRTSTLNGSSPSNGSPRTSLCDSNKKVKFVRVWPQFQPFSCYSNPTEESNTKSYEIIGQSDQGATTQV